MRVASTSIPSANSRSKIFCQRGHGLALAKDDFGKTAAALAVQVDLRFGQIGGRRPRDLAHELVQHQRAVEQAAWPIVPVRARSFFLWYLDLAVPCDGTRQSAAARPTGLSVSGLPETRADVSNWLPKSLPFPG